MTTTEESQDSTSLTEISSLAQRIRATIADQIAAGQLEPGARLDETGLAERFEVSRTPVREALKQLQALGLITRGPRRTQIVAELSLDELDRMFEYMGEMEALCGRLAALNMTHKERGQLEALQVACRAALRDNNADAYAEADRGFHQAISEGTHNPFAIEAAQSIRLRMMPFRRHQLLTGERLIASQAEHEVILTAILQGNAERASQTLRQHIAAVRESYRIAYRHRRDPQAHLATG